MTSFTLGLVKRYLTSRIIEIKRLNCNVYASYPCDRVIKRNTKSSIPLYPTDKCVILIYAMFIVFLIIRRLIPFLFEIYRKLMKCVPIPALIHANIQYCI